MLNSEPRGGDFAVVRADSPAPGEGGNPRPEGAGYPMLSRESVSRESIFRESGQGGTGSEAGLADYFRLVRRRKGTIFLVAFGCAVLGFLSVLPQTPLFRAGAQLEIQTTNEDFGYSKDINPNSNNGALYPDVDLATQVRVLSTRSLLDRAVAKLDADPDLRVAAPRDRLSAWRHALRLPPGQVPGRRQAIEATAATLSVKSSRNSRVIEILCDSQDPNLAAAFVNTIATEYIERSIESRWQSARHTGEWLSRQLDEIKVNLERSEDQLQNYATSMNLVFSGDKDRTNVSQERLSQLQSELSVAQGDRVSKQAKHELAASGRTEAVGQVVDDVTLRAFEAKLIELRRELAELTSTLGPAHYRVKKVQAQIAEMDADRRKAGDRIVERIANDYREAGRRENLLQDAYRKQALVLSDQASKITHYNILKREVETNRQLYESLLQKVKEAGIGAALRASNIQVIDRAQPPSAPFNPDLRRGASLGLIFGLFAGFGLVLAQEKLSRRIEAPGEAAFYLNVPELGVVPSWSIDRATAGEGRKRLFALGYHLHHRSNAAAGDPAVTTFRRSQSIAAEAFRAILTSILYVGRKRPTQVIVVSSPGASEGKTTILSNLAIGFAETNRSVLVIDADMRRPRLHDIFEVPNEQGLAELLGRREPLSPRDLLLGARATKFAGVCVLPSGSLDTGAAALLHSKRLMELIALAREQFDVVLIDTPPMLHLADARIVGSLADGLLLVIRARQTSRDALISVKRRLTEDGIPVIGSALNDWNPKAAGSYGYESYLHYYSSFYSKQNPSKGA